MSAPSQGNYRNDSVWSGTFPGQFKCIFCAGHFKNNVRAAVLTFCQHIIYAIFRFYRVNFRIVFLDKCDSLLIGFTKDYLLWIF